MPGKKFKEETFRKLEVFLEVPSSIYLDLYPMFAYLSDLFSLII